MSCDNTTYRTVVDLDQCSSPKPELGDWAAARKTQLERHQSLKQGQRGVTADTSQSKGRRHEDQARMIPDSTQTEPEYVWGDEGPIND